MAVSGTFYPDSCRKIKAFIFDFNQRFNHIKIPVTTQSIAPKAVIVPHAGFIYSGFTANMAYRFLAHRTPKRIIVIGPSHRYYFKGISGSFFETYQTPCGDLQIDTPYLFALSQQFNIGFVPQAHHKEHSTEVQMPFIRYYFPKTKLIELIYGDIKDEILLSIVQSLLRNPSNAVVISSDLSHFYSLEQAKKRDRYCLLGVQDLDPSLLQYCEACGLIGIKAMVKAAKSLHLSSKLLDYTTSAMVTNDTHSVVGYMSAMFY